MSTTRNDLLSSKEYWIAKWQLSLFMEVDQYLKQNNISRTEFADRLGVTKGYVSQILNGNADHKLSKIIELSLAIGKVPTPSFQNIDTIIDLDKEETDIKNTAKPRVLISEVKRKNKVKKVASKVGVAKPH